VQPVWAGKAAQAGVSAAEIVIGQSITLQNGQNAYGVEVQAGIQTYLKQLNANGGVHGRRVVLRSLDDLGQAKSAESNARELVAQGA
jgi:branched-chain amino acid transport system substrate-binding protein